jgi:hypothetical protein
VLFGTVVVAEVAAKAKAPAPRAIPNALPPATARRVQRDRRTGAGGGKVESGIVIANSLLASRRRVLPRDG